MAGGFVETFLLTWLWVHKRLLIVSSLLLPPWLLLCGLFCWSVWRLSISTSTFIFFMSQILAVFYFSFLMFLLQSSYTRRIVVILMMWGWITQPANLHYVMSSLNDAVQDTGYAPMKYLGMVDLILILQCLER